MFSELVKFGIPEKEKSLGCSTGFCLDGDPPLVFAFVLLVEVEIEYL